MCAFKLVRHDVNNIGCEQRIQSWGKGKHNLAENAVILFRGLSANSDAKIL